MGIDISKFSNNNDVVEVVENQQPAVPEVAQDNFDIVEYTNNKKMELRKSKEVENLTSLIEVDNPNTILQFGKEASEGIARVSDSLLSTIKMNQNEKNSEMLVRLTKIMDKFDLDDFAKTKEPNFFQKMFKKANSAIEVMFQKYETLGGEVEKIQIELQNYEREIGDSNKQLGAMLNENFNYYNELQKYIVAGEMGVEELDNELLPQFKAKADITTSNPTEFTVTAEGLANADASVTFDDITIPIVKNVTVEPQYVDYTLKLEHTGNIIKGKENQMTLSYSSSMGRYYEHARLVAEATSPAGATVRLLATDKSRLEHDIIQSGWGDAQGYKIGGKDVSQVLQVRGIFSEVGDYTITLKLIDRDNSDSVIAQETFNFTAQEETTTPPETTRYV